MKKYIAIILLLGVFKISFSQENQKKGHIFNSIVGNNSEPVLYNDVNLNTYELLTTNFQVSKDDNLHKIVFSPMKLINSERIGFLRETKVNLAQKNGISTLGIGVGFDNSSPFSKRGTKTLNNAFLNFPALRPKINNEKDYEYELYKSKFYYSLDSAYAKTYEELLKNSYKFTFGYNISLFEVIGGDKVDLDNDGVIDNFYVSESDNLSLGITYIFSSKTAINIVGHYSSKLASQKESEKRVDFLGGSLSFAQQLIVLDKKYLKSSDYLKSLFIPSINGGASLEYQKAVSNELFAKNGITNALAITPFLEFKLNPKNQVRFGVPMKINKGVIKEVSFGPFLQWSLQIAKVE